MKTFLFDIEGNDLWPNVSRIWTCVIQEEGGPRHVFHEDRMSEAVDLLNTGDRIVAHNGIWYDRPALEKITGKKLIPKLIDTLVMSRLVYPDIYDHPIGGNSIEDWGRHLGIPKGEFNDWTKWSEEMDEYCGRDVDILGRICSRLIPLAVQVAGSSRCEHAVSSLLFRQHCNGYGFDSAAAGTLQESLAKASLDAEYIVQSKFPPQVKQLKTKQKVTPFNPGSRQQIAAWLKEYHGWVPTEFTDKGNPVTSGEVLSKLDIPELKPLLEYFDVEKVKGMVEGWIEKVRDGKIHGSVNTNGAVTGRMTHSDPNLAQVPRIKFNKAKAMLLGREGGWGLECRSLFHPTRQGWSQVGADAAGLELRMLAHYLSRYDGGKYAKIVCEGDVHTYNQTIVGLDLCKTRDDSKTMIYGTIYGAQGKKVAKILGCSEKDGYRARDRLLTGIDGMEELLASLKFQKQKLGYIVGLDGRHLPVRSNHLILNTLLQSAGAVVMKVAVLEVDASEPYQTGHAFFMANIHDEWQSETDIDGNVVGKIKVEAIKNAGTRLGLGCPLDGTHRVGRNWADTH